MLLFRGLQRARRLLEEFAKGNVLFIRKSVEPLDDFWSRLDMDLLITACLVTRPGGRRACATRTGCRLGKTTRVGELPDWQAQDESQWRVRRSERRGPASCRSHLVDQLHALRCRLL